MNSNLNTLALGPLWDEDWSIDGMSAGTTHPMESLGMNNSKSEFKSTHLSIKAILHYFLIVLVTPLMSPPIIFSDFPSPQTASDAETEYHQ